MDLSQGLTLYALMFSLLMGLVSFVSPCILPLIPSYVSYITGISYDDLVSPEAQKKNVRTTLQHSLAFVAGFSIIFVLLGATASFMGQILIQYLDVIRISGGILIMIMGIFVMDVLPIPFLQREAKFRLKNRPAGYVGTVIVGMIFGAGWTPCTGPFLGSVLALAMEADTLGRGMVLLMFYSLGLGIPFILSALAISEFLTHSSRLKPHLKTIKIVSGVVLIIMGILLITNSMTLLTSYSITFWEKIKSIW